MWQQQTLAALTLNTKVHPFYTHQAFIAPVGRWMRKRKQTPDQQQGMQPPDVDVQVPAMRTVPHGWLRAGWPLLWHGGTAKQCASTSQELPSSLLPRCRHRLHFRHGHFSPDVREGNGAITHLCTKQWLKLPSNSSPTGEQCLAFSPALPVLCVSYRHVLFQRSVSLRWHHPFATRVSLRTETAS